MLVSVAYLQHTVTYVLLDKLLCSFSDGLNCLCGTILTVLPFCLSFLWCCIVFMVVQPVEHWTCDQQVVGSNPTWGKSCITTLGNLFTPMCLCHQAV